MDIDRQSRDHYAELLRHFASGRLTNTEYDEASEAYVAARDLALSEIWWQMWYTYDDLHEHRLTGKHELPREGRTDVARMVVFLHSDLPYEWPVPSRLLGCLLNAITLGVWGRVFRPSTGGGDEAVWPFFRADDFARAVARPRLLGGAR